MSERTTVGLQQGLWIDQRRLAAAGLQAPLEITVQPGEIRIRSAEVGRGLDAAVIREVEDAYPMIDEAFRDDWSAPGMEDYDRYEDLAPLRKPVG